MDGAGAWPVLGRDDEVDYLAAALVEGAPGAVVSGDLGVGKTSLAGRVAERLADLGWVISTHAASEARSGIPFAAFGSLLDAGGDSTDPLDRLLRATERVRSSGGAGVLVQVDDAHWLDDTSVAFVQHLAESASATLLFTVRVPHERSGRMTALARTLGLTRLQLQPLSQTETIALVRDVLPDAGAAVAHRLWALTEGNPLYLREVVTRSVEAHGVGPWGPDDIADTALADVVDARLDDLDAAERHALELVAVGGDTSVAVLGELTSEQAVVALEGRRLLAVTEDERRLVARLTHPIYGELIVARMGATGRRRCRGELLAAIEHHGRRRRSDLIQSAVWSIEQGDDADPAMLLDVARQLCAIVPDEPVVLGLPALRGDLLGTAARLAMAAADRGGGFEAAEVWFQIESGRDGGSPATADALQRMRALAVDEATETTVLVAASSLQLANGWASSPEVIAQLEELQASVTTPTARRSVDTMLAVTMALYDRHEEAIGLARSALDDEATANRDRLLAAATLSGGLVQQGRAIEGLEVAEAAILEVGADPDPWGLGALIIARINALACCGRLVEAEELTSQCLLLAQATGNESSVYLFALARGLLALLRGHPEDAIEAATLSLSSFSRQEEVDATADRPAFAVLAQAHALLGRRAEAVEAVGRMGRSRSQLFAPAKERAEAAVAALEGRRSGAVDLLRATAEAGSGGVPGVVTCLHDLLRLGETGIGEEVRRLADVTGSPLWDACARQADAVDAGDARALDEVAEAFATMGADLWAAEAAACAAAAHRAGGDAAAASRSAARSDELAARCPGVVSPLLALGVEAGPSLTKREREVAQLAADGWTDKAIADELVLSVRTVESHLYRIYFKLGIDGRSDLPSVLDR